MNSPTAEIIRESKVKNIVAFLQRKAKELGEENYQGHVAAVFQVNIPEETEYMVQRATEFHECNEGELQKAYKQVFGVGPFCNF